MTKEEIERRNELTSLILYKAVLVSKSGQTTAERAVIRLINAFFDDSDPKELTQAHIIAQSIKN